MKTTVCPYCVSEKRSDDFRGCCGESSAHFLAAESCYECGTIFIFDDDKEDFEHCAENDLCRKCNDKLFREEQRELAGLRSMGY